MRRPKNWNFLQQGRKGVKGFEDGSNLDEENAFEGEFWPVWIAGWRRIVLLLRSVGVGEIYKLR